MPGNTQAIGVSGAARGQRAGIARAFGANSVSDVGLVVADAARLAHVKIGHETIFIHIRSIDT